MKNIIKTTIPVVLSIFMVVSANTKRNNHFIGKWEIDLSETVSVNDLPTGSIQSLNIDPSNHVINFGLAGNYNERFGGLNFKGTWSRYDLGIAIARLESDNRIKNLKKHLNQKVKRENKNRHELTRLYQRIHKVNQMSVRTYTYKNGNVFLEQDGMNIVLVFRRVG